MNNIDDMPPMCHDCPYWEICEKPYVCPTQDEKNFVSDLNKNFNSLTSQLITTLSQPYFKKRRFSKI